MFNTQLMMGLLSGILRSVVDKGVTAEMSALEGPIVYGQEC